MKRAVISIICLLVLIIPFIGCVDDTATPAKPLATQEFVTAQDNAVKQELRTQMDQRATVAYVDQKVAALPQSTASYTKAEVDAKVAELQAKNSTLESRLSTMQTAIDELKTKVGTTIPGTTTPTTPATTGQVSYTLLNPQQWYTFNTSGIVAIRITNGKADNRYVRPQLTMSTYPSGTVAALTSATATITSNSQGQPAIIFGSAGVGTPITSWGTCTQIIFIPTSGGMSGGQYLIAPGTAMDIYVTITMAPAYPGLWTLSVSGTDLSMTGN